MCDSNSQESEQSIAKVVQPFQDRNVMNSSVPDYNVSQTERQTFGDNGKPQRKRRKLPISEIRLMDASTDTEITMVDQACQTDLPFIVPSPHTFKSIPLAGVRHAVANDHNYATLLSDSPVVPAEQVPGVSGKDFPKSKRTLDFSEMDTSDFLFLFSIFFFYFYFLSVSIPKTRIST